jgi:hypothetical protein
MTEENILGGFRGTVFVPLSSESVTAKLDIQLRTPTPPGEASEPSSPWISKTPKTAIETKSQSEYFTRRIRRHHSSSLESIIEALHCLSRGAEAAMHKVTLLVAENKELRQANEILSWRRRQKGIRLQKGGAITVQEASQVIDQTKVKKSL